MQPSLLDTTTMGFLQIGAEYLLAGGIEAVHINQREHVYAF